MNHHRLASSTARSAFCIAILALAGCAAVPQPDIGPAQYSEIMLPVTRQPGDWPEIGRQPGGARFSPLAQITPANAASLAPAWTYNMRPPEQSAVELSAAEQAQAAAEQGGGPGGSAFGGAAARQASSFAATETIPLVIDGTMYLGTPYSQIVALNAATGAQLWTHELGDADLARRGMAYWPGNESAPAALLFGTDEGLLRSVRVADGAPSAQFGANGAVNLRTPDVMVGGMDKRYSLTSPPIVYRDVVITGAAVGEGIGGSRGDVRGWSAATGEHLWTLKSIPDPSEPGSETWGGNSGFNRSGVNVWGLMSVDPVRGIVYLPFGAPANDRVGVDRPGNNLYSSSIVAADALTGRYLWHFQVVHHDIWDNDTAAAPVLFDMQVDGEIIPAVAIVSKNGLIFTLNRVTGEPIHEIVERPVPQSEVPGEIVSPTQPFPVRPEPLSRMSFTPDDVSTITPEHEQFCRALIADNDLAYGGPYNPPTYNRPGVYFPGTLGGVNWSGGSYDPALGLFLVNPFQLGQIMQITPGENGVLSNRGPLNGRFWDQSTRMPCQEGPWGELVAVDLAAGEVAWRVPLGLSENLPADKQLTGRPSIGGPITTAGGLTFVAATDDRRIRAFETRTGNMVWEYQLPASAHTNPITYSVGGKQYVAIVSTGGSFLASPVESDQLTVFALEE